MGTSNGNAVDYFIDRHLREGRGGRLAFADPRRRLSYADLAAASARFAAGLRDAGQVELAYPAGARKREAARPAYGDHQ